MSMTSKLFDLHDLYFTKIDFYWKWGHMYVKLCWSWFWQYFSPTLPHMTSRLWLHDPHDLYGLLDLHFIKINFNQSEDIVHQNIGFKLCWSQFWEYFSTTRHIWPPGSDHMIPMTSMTSMTSILSKSTIIKVKTNVCQNIGFKLCWPQFWQYFSPTLPHLTSRLWPHNPYDLHDLHFVNININ